MVETKGSPDLLNREQDAAAATLEAVLDELDAATARVRQATFVVAELEEGLEEGEVGRAELAAAGRR